MTAFSEKTIAASPPSGGEIARAARAVAATVAHAATAQKNAVLQNFIAQLQDNAKNIMAANRRDLAAAGELSDALKDRLFLDEKRMRGMTEGLAAIIALPDPVGEMSDFAVRPSGISVGKMRTPLGVILAIYESRPNVTADIAALALKAGNAVILRGGGEAKHSNAAIGECLSAALDAAELPAAAAQVVADSSRALVDELLSREEIDLAIPRGGRGLIERVAAVARMPVLKHLDGNCHVYVDAAADLTMAEKIVINAKTRRYGVCSAAESLLVHRATAAAFLPQIAAALSARKVEMRGCAETRKIIRCAAATEDDWRAEYLAPIISIKIVADADEAVAHINEFGSGHTDAVVTDSVRIGRRFLREVDSSSVMLNASTAFADGGEFGLGAEVGISTGKLHARGPVGLAGLTCQKYVVFGNGEIRA
ncbi:MAG: glutamate-5-semialdehyde dehydrogenase [Gammaproteobacteria bacterium]